MEEDLRYHQQVLADLLLKYPDGLTGKGWSLKGLMANPSASPRVIRYCWRLMKTRNWSDRSECVRLLSSNPALTPQLMDKYWRRLSRRVDLLSKNPSISPELIDKHWKDWGGEYSPCINNLSANPALTVELMIKYWGELYPDLLADNPSINEGSVEAYCNQLTPESEITPRYVKKCWDEIKRYREEYGYPLAEIPKQDHDLSLTPQLMIERWDQLDKDNLSSHPNLTYDLVLRFPDDKWNNYKLSKKVWSHTNSGRQVKSARNKM